ncbi:hypothetical protein LSH36_2036g00013 [Paralvinella palmiformis]|uniref:Uncharacterized protein n=1 Tax=Paralvinella palmiformis TaxID=53620 RepID=A0AAD9IQP0_9ANNE|nr:hypothetical protein LSH36_2036g00013 [Paralvinella palmiformis]
MFTALLLDKKAKLVTLFIRDLLEREQSYDWVLASINNTDRIAPAYYIVAGTRPEQGAIITKARLYAFDDWKLDTNHNR